MLETIDWEVVGAVAEALGALGVIASMVYLASQIRQNTLSNRIAAKQNTTDQFIAFSRDLALDPELAKTWKMGREQSEGLTDEQRRTFHYINRQVCFAYSAQWSQHELGAVSEDDWHESVAFISQSWLGHPGTRAWWEENKGVVHQGFRCFVDREILAEER